MAIGANATREVVSPVTDRASLGPPREPAAWLRRQERRLVLGIGLVALLHGLAYVVLLPPWQHYEEPSHFEFAWIISQTGRLPDYPAFDQAKRREIAASMIAHAFFRDLGFLPDLQATDQPIWIGINVSGAVPLYHILAALPLRLAPNAPVEAQLYLARLVSLGLYLATIGLAYAVVAEVTAPGHTLRWAVPAALALLPGFADLMTAVNNDVGATAMFSLYLWATVRLVARGLGFWQLLGVLAAAGLCAATKNTVLIAVPLVLVAASLALWSRLAAAPVAGRARWPPRLSRGWALALGALPLLALALGLAATLAWGDAALWYRSTNQAAPTRALAAPAAPGLGRHALALALDPTGASGGALRQPIPPDLVAELAGQPLTLGAWMWASEPVTVYAPALVDRGQATLNSVTVGTQPAFYAWPTGLAPDAQFAHLLIQLDPNTAPGRALTVYYDGLVLATGERPLAEPPTFASPAAAGGTWGGRPFVNYARNASAETGCAYVRPWAEALALRVAEAHISPSILLGALLDWRSTSWLYTYTAGRLFNTFWGSFAWGHVSLPAIAYNLLAWVTGLGVLAAGLRLRQSFGRLERARRLALAWLGLALLAVWGIVLVRGLFTMLDPAPYVPTARYAYPVIIPTLLLLVAGWSFWPARWQSSSQALRDGWPIVFWTGFIALDVASIVAIVQFYSGR